MLVKLEMNVLTSIASHDDVSLRFIYTKGLKVPGNECVNNEQPRDFVLAHVVSEANYRRLLNAMIFDNISMERSTRSDIPEHGLLQSRWTHIYS